MKMCTIFFPTGEHTDYEEGKDGVETILDRSDDYPVVRIFRSTEMVIYKGLPFVIIETRVDRGYGRGKP